MRICLVGPSYPFRGGIAHYTTLLYKHLRPRHDSAFFSFSRQYPRWLFPGKTDKDNSQIAIKEEGVEATLDSMNPWSWYLTYKKIRAHQPDVVIFPWWIFFWMPQFAFLTRMIHANTDARVLFICHNVVAHESHFIARWCTKYVLTGADLFLVHSSEDLKNLKAMIPQATVKQVFHPSYDQFPRTDLSKESARRLLGVDGHVILFFGFVRPYKGLDYLLDALPRILAEQQVKLLIVGEFWRDKARYLQKIKTLGIDDAVQVSDAYVSNEEIERYFVAADLLVMPYTSATGSGIVQLSFGFGLPVVVTSVGALPEVVKDGETGFVVPPMDSEVLAEKVLAFFKNGLGKTFAENIDREKYRFTWNHLIGTIEELTIS